MAHIHVGEVLIVERSIHSFSPVQFSLLPSSLGLLRVIGGFLVFESQVLEFVSGHQIPVHPTRQIILRQLPTLWLVRPSNLLNTPQILHHNILAFPIMIERKASALRRYRLRLVLQSSRAAESTHFVVQLARSASGMLRKETSKLRQVAITFLRPHTSMTPMAPRGTRRARPNCIKTMIR